MTIDEAIKHEEENAWWEYGMVDTYHTDEGVYGKEESYHREKAEHHEQVAMWLKELKAHREAMLDDVQVKECYTCYHCGDMFRGHGDGCYDPCEGCKENGYKNYKKE